MKQVELNQTGHQVSAMGIGAMRLSLKGRPDRSHSVEVIHEALDRGVTFFDTADSYCIDEGDKHHNEQLLAEAFASYNDDTSDVVIATKGGLMRHDGRWPRNGDPAHLRKTIRESHSILGGDGPIQLWQHHAPDPDVPLRNSLQVIQQAVEEGIIQWVGVSNYSVEQIELAQEFVDVVSVQNQYNPWRRNPERNGVLDYCESNGLTFLPWAPLGGERKSKALEDDPTLSTIADAHDASPQQVVLAWLMSRSPCVLPIPGVTRFESLADSLNALNLDLSDDEIERIENDVQ